MTHSYTVKQMCAAFYPDERGVPGTLFQIEPERMANRNYGVIGCPYTFGQTRIKLLDMRLDAAINIVREMCSYNPLTVIETIAGLAGADDPEAYCRELAKPWNTEDIERGRIRLDNTPEDRICEL